MPIQEYRPMDLMWDKKITKYEFNDFIGKWDGFVTKPLCKDLINYFNSTLETGSNGTQEVEFVKGEEQYVSGMNRKDISMMLNYSNEGLSYQVNQFLKSCILHYVEEYSQLKTIGLVSTDLKMQKTCPGGGYHLWHYENGAASHSMRELAWMVYLNDVPEGEGETEFMYQKRRINPTQGTVVIWPAGMTHVHKGNTVFTTDKYILTGWYIKTGSGG